MIAIARHQFRTHLIDEQEIDLSSMAIFSDALYTAGVATCAIDEDWMMTDGMRTGADFTGGLPETLLKAYREVCAVVENLRQSRDVLHQTTVSRLQSTTEKLKEVSNATEVAATGILDGLDRSIALVDKLDAIDASGSEEAIAARVSLRDELYQAQACLQFQDITTQQLNYASSILVDMEERLVELARSLDVAGTVQATAVPYAPPANATFDPRATVQDADIRQALADAIFTTRH